MSAVAVFGTYLQCEKVERNKGDGWSKKKADGKGKSLVVNAQ